MLNVDPVLALPSRVDHVQKLDGVRALDARLTLTLPPGEIPQPGEYIVTVGKKGFGSAYLITRVTPSPSKVCRFYLTCQRGHTPQDAEKAGFWWEIRWKARRARDRQAAVCAQVNGGAE